jgi:microcystin-dependent protein
MIRRIVSILTVAILGLGCIPGVQEQVVMAPPYPKPDGTPKTLHERQKDAPEVDGEVVDNGLDVQVHQRTECRDVEATPMLQDKTTERKLNGGATSYWLNGGTAVVLAGVGAALAFGNCTDTPQATATNPNPPSTPCTASEASGRQAGGYVTMGLAIVPVAFMVYNAIHSADSTETIPALPFKEPKPWAACANRPLPNEQVTVAVGGATFQGTTGPNGHAMIDLSGVQPTAALVASPTAVVQHRGSQNVTISLRGSSAYNSWKARLDAEAAERQAAMERASAEERRQHEALKAVVSRLDGWARSSIKVNWASTQHSETHCFNMVDFEVPCTSAAAFRKQDNFSIINQATVANTGKLAMVCGQSGDFLGNGKTFVQLGPGRQVTLPAVESAGLGLLFAMFGGGGQNTVVCGVPSSAVSTALGVDASLVTGQGTNLIIGIVGSDAYGFTGGEKDSRLFQWDSSDVVVK